MDILHLAVLSDKSADKIADELEKSSLVKKGLKFLQSRGFTQHFFFAFRCESRQADDLTAHAYKLYAFLKKNSMGFLDLVISNS